MKPPSARRVRVLAVSGSLRAASSSSALVRAAARLVPEGVEVGIYAGLGDLPHFNPDLEADPPAPVRELERRVGEADAVWISTPEYAHGIPGVLKNMLDWLVGGVAFVEKPVALLNPSSRGVHAQAQLTEILKTMSGRIVPGATVTVEILGKNLTDERIAADPTLAAAIRGALEAFARYLPLSPSSG